MKTTFDDLNIIQASPLYAESDFASIDIELYHADKSRLHRPTGEFASMQISFDGKNVYVIQNVNDLTYLFGDVLPRVKTWVMQNAKFDITQLRRWVKIPPRDAHDTLLFDRILWSGYFDTFNLADQSRRYLQLYMEKETREEFYKTDVMNDEMIHYAALDAAATWRIAQRQLKIARPEDCYVWREFDQTAMWALLDFRGFPIDVDRWMEMAIRNKAEADAMKAEFIEKHGFNPNSHVQVKT